MLQISSCLFNYYIEGVAKKVIVAGISRGLIYNCMQMTLCYWVKQQNHRTLTKFQIVFTTYKLMNATQSKVMVCGKGDTTEWSEATEK